MFLEWMTDGLIDIFTDLLIDCYFFDCFEDFWDFSIGYFHWLFPSAGVISRPLFHFPHCPVSQTCLCLVNKAVRQDSIKKGVFVWYEGWGSEDLWGQEIIFPFSMFLWKIPKVSSELSCSPYFRGPHIFSPNIGGYVILFQCFGGLWIFFRKNPLTLPPQPSVRNEHSIMK